jgi:thiamine-phosphate diphosphorylase
MKPATAGDLAAVARMARRVCTELGAALVINDRIDIALAVGADAVHLGQTDLPLATARALLGDAIGGTLAFGISTHNPVQVAEAVAARPAYIAYGPVFPTSTKQNPDPVQGLAALRAAVELAGDIPVVAIGGVTPAQAAALYETGVASLCAISAVNGGNGLAAVVAAARSLGQTICL